MTGASVRERDGDGAGHHVAVETGQKLKLLLELIGALIELAEDVGQFFACGDQRRRQRDGLSSARSASAAGGARGKHRPCR